MFACPFGKLPACSGAPLLSAAIPADHPSCQCANPRSRTGRFTLPETNIFAPENGWLEDEFPFGMAYFRVL